MYHAVISGAFHGMDSFLVQVEVDISNGLPGMEMVGCLAGEVKETKERVRVGLKNSGYELPVKRITISLSPADRRKDGSGFDLPVALGILGASLLTGENETEKDKSEVNNSNIIVLGEIGLDGVIKGVKGILPILLKAVEEKITYCILPFDNRCEASNVKGIKLYPVRTLQEAFRVYEALFHKNITNVVQNIPSIGKSRNGDKNVPENDFLNRNKVDITLKMKDFATKEGKDGKDCKNNNFKDGLNQKKEENDKYSSFLETVEYNFARKNSCMETDAGNDREDDEITLDFKQVVGQEHAKRAAVIAAAGFHNLLLFGPPGSGKSMIAQRMPEIMKNMCYDECLEVTKIYSVAGLLNKDTALITKRPFMSPHHTVSDAALVGGGVVPRPGIITLAHRGILFLDELPEFGRYKLDLLRQPLEEKTVQISRMNYTCNYQADFMLVAAMNPCPCGFYPDRRRCNCSEATINRYLGRISGPLLDRIDLSVEVGRMTWEQAAGQTGNKERDPERNTERNTEGNTEGNMGGNYVNQWSSAYMRKQVGKAVRMQMERNKGKYNSALDGEEIGLFCRMDGEAETFLKYIFDKMELSMRSLNRLKKVARTIADLDGEEMIKRGHLSEAVMLNKGLERLKRTKGET